MFRTVLVPVDGSPLAEHALPWAVAAAGPGGAVHLVHCHVPPAPLLVEGVVIADPTLDQTLRDSVADYLSGLVERVRAVAPSVRVDARNLDSEDPPADALAADVTETGSDLVVMATHGRGAFARFWLGSTTHELVRASPRPVLTVRPPEDATADLSARPAVERVVVPVDGSELAEAVLPAAKAFGAAFGASFTLLLVRAKGDQLTVDEATLDRTAGELDDGRGVARVEVVERGSTAAAILEFVGADPKTVVALATHGRTGVQRLLHGSVADELIRKATGPVLVYHPSGSV
jgi:nucleotide-binding universal stress UspA family protein